MPDYRFSGLYSYAPDRGSTNGNKEPVSEEFEADDDKEAAKWVKNFRRNRVPIVQPRLVKIVAREKTERIKL